MRLFPVVDSSNGENPAVEGSVCTCQQPSSLDQPSKSSDLKSPFVSKEDEEIVSSNPGKGVGEIPEIPLAPIMEVSISETVPVEVGRFSLVVVASGPRVVAVEVSPKLDVRAGVDAPVLLESEVCAAVSGELFPLFLLFKPPTNPPTSAPMTTTTTTAIIITVFRVNVNVFLEESAG
ncbi:uncharacterized protein DFL_008280 [Arthrobotrys flagrans]|uniref:Uncharacterized protein n=1 Tax=Arthrobotrys flagrans TaxID=97331 RepID=A0A436ZNG2_ARTFL|nr:hypothetical protein DFL_008280 [Arthrobotrys flagrans]